MRGFVAFEYEKGLQIYSEQVNKKKNRDGLNISWARRLYELDMDS